MQRGQSPSPVRTLQMGCQQFHATPDRGLYRLSDSVMTPKISVNGFQ